MTVALKRSVDRLLGGDASRRIAVTLKDGGGRYCGQLVAIEDEALTLGVEDGGECDALLCVPVNQILSVELINTAPQPAASSPLSPA